ncbi:MAG: transglutaminase [Geobacteraceae bacterium GWC2_58_44]|nr:MAG: transglutaminase [Geobacteraceae bacterium GWC2_58_44]
MVRIKGVLGALTVCIALIGYLPLQPYLDPLARWFFPASLALGLYLQMRNTVLPGRLLTPLSILVFLYFASGFTMDSMIVVTADLLVVFLGIRMLGERSGRNYLQVFALSLFCLAASSLYNLSALFLVYLLLLLLLLAVSLVVLTFHSHDPEIALARPELKKVLCVSGLMPVASLPILLFLFVLLPRTQYPLWDYVNRSAPKVTGFSETVNPGGSASQAEVKSVVLRAICSKVPDQMLYWRGIVLNGFRDNAWVRLPAPQEKSLRAEPGLSVQQEIYPEPSGNPYLLALNIPRTFTGLRHSESADTVFTVHRPLENRTKYQVQSVLSGAIQVKGGVDRDFYLALPRTVSDRLRAKGRDLARPGLGVEQKLELAEQFFRDQRLGYATAGLPVGPDPIDAFLFVTKRGNCEFFASSFATLLRLAGVPARLVGGYRGGSYNEMGGYYLVTEDMAHVWVEAYVEGRGWVSIDPSAWSTGFARREGAGRKLRMYVDALGFYWNKAVITYDLEKQISLVRSAGGRARNLRFPERIWRALVVPALALLPLAALLALYLRRPRSAEERVLKRFLRAARRRYPAAFREQSGLFELAESLGDPHVKEFAGIYGAAVYRDQRLKPDELLRLKEIIRILGQHLS